MTQDDTTFTLGESLAAQKTLRDTLGLREEVFAVPAFVGMISDEIEQLRAAGKTDSDIAALIQSSTGKSLSGRDIADHYVAPGDRHKEG